MHSLRSIVRWVVRIVERRWSLGESVLVRIPEVGKGPRNFAPKLADKWKSAVWLDKSDLTDEHLVRTDDGVLCARSVRQIAEHFWSEENVRAVVETPQKPESTTSILLLLFHSQYQKCMKTRKRNSQRTQRKTKRCRWIHQTQR